MTPLRMSVINDGEQKCKIRDHEKKKQVRAVRSLKLEIKEKYFLHI